MIGNIIVWLVLLVATVGLAWLTRRAFGTRNRLVKWAGGGLAALLTLLAGLVTVVAAMGLVKLYAPVGTPVRALQVASTPEQIARGQHLANAFCIQCHSPTGNGPLIGGVDLGADLPLPLGKFISVNPTPAGPLSKWSDGQILRILREGAAPDGWRLIMMGAVRARHMSDEDLSFDGHPTSPLAPVGANLRVVKGWTSDQFIATLRTGVDPSGHHLSDVMPWRSISQLDDVELGAIYEFLKTQN